MPLPNDEKLIALSNDILAQVPCNLRTVSGLSSGPRQRCFADWDIYTVGRRYCADQGSACVA